MCKVNDFNLPDKEYKFCRAYVETLNATKAAVMAGYGEAGARTTGYKLLKKADVLACVRDMQAHLAETMEESAIKIVTEVLEIARKSTTQDRDRIKAFELAANLLGHNQPTKIEAKVDADVNAKVNGNLNLNIRVGNGETAEDIDKLGDL